MMCVPRMMRPLYEPLYDVHLLRCVTCTMRLLDDYGSLGLGVPSGTDDLFFLFCSSVRVGNKKPAH
jgi:hypothetical protein